MTEQDISPEEITQHYSALLDSVNLVNSIVNNTHNLQPEHLADAVAVNVEHMQTMLSKTFWTSEHNLGIVEAAIAAGNQYLEI